ncbi:YkyB family protein [Clostridium perfringens]|uniref:YkyB family protein n=1 Tax=Clostridium perfringens TaxID=1502 RepID=UPI0039ED9345
MRFRSFFEWKEKIKRGEIDVYYVTYLKELGFKIKEGEKPFVYVDVYVNGFWKRNVPAYKIEQTSKISKRRTDIRLLDINNENLCISLYVINKSAKKSRDTKQKSYDSKIFKTTNYSKTRETLLYQLKKEVIYKMVSEGRLQVIGYHKQFENYLILYKYKEYSFHIPTNFVPKDITYLGEIESLISLESNIKTIKFSEAKLLLKTYLNK